MSTSRQSDTRTRHRTRMLIAGVATLALTAATVGTIDAGAPAPPKAAVDFDGDDTSDYGIVRDASAGAAFNLRSIQDRMESPGFRAAPAADSASFDSHTDLAWYVHLSDSAVPSVHGFGQPATDFWIPSDYNGDGQDELAVWRGLAPTGPNGGVLFTHDIQDDVTTEFVFGQDGDNPTVVGDYDGDDIDDPAVYRCPTGGGQCHFYYHGSATDTTYSVAWGNDSATLIRPYPGDFDGDGTHDFAIFQNGYYILKRSSDGGVEYVRWGVATDPVIAPGDYDGDGRTDFMNVRVNGTDVEWWLLERDGDWNATVWGATVPGFAEFATQADFDGDGATDRAVWRRDNSSASNSFFWVLRSSDAQLEAFQWGSQSDAPLPGWNSN